MTRVPLPRVPLLAVLAALLALVPAAHAAVTGTARVASASGTARVEVTLKGASGRSAATAVTVTVGGRSFVLARRTALRWRSRPFTGRAAAQVVALAGKRATVRVRTRSGSLTIRPRLTGPAAGGGTTPGTTPGAAPGTSPQPLFAPPAQELTGNDAFTHLSGFFLNSRFTDCVAGWPNCAVEERYVNCPTGAWEYHRYTPTSGADINSYGGYTVTGALARTDGSWGIEYVVSAYGNQYFYSWDVAANGVVTGRYWAAGTFPPAPPSQLLGPFAWAQPAGGC